MDWKPRVMVISRKQQCTVVPAGDKQQTGDAVDGLRWFYDKHVSYNSARSHGVWEEGRLGVPGRRQQLSLSAYRHGSSVGRLVPLLRQQSASRLGEAEQTLAILIPLLTRTM
jgi:hypothetical protein